MKSMHKLHVMACALCALFALAASITASANTALWIGNPGVTATTNWSDQANWNNIGAGGAGPLHNDVIFGGDGSVDAAGTITSVADVNQNPFSITFTNGPGQFHTLYIPADIGLTNDNGLAVGGVTANAYTTVVNVTGDGIWVQNGTPVTIQDYGSSVSTALATLDLSGLNSFLYNNSGGTINVGGTGGNRSAGSLSLAGGSNYITVGTLNLATGSGANAATSSLKLGAGTNIINVGAFNIVNNKNSATLSFQAGTGGLRLRGVGGTDADRANFTVANRNQTGTGVATGTLALDGHPVDILAATMIVGQNSAGSSTDTGTGNLQFDTGTVDVTTLNLAVCSNPNAAGFANGTVTVGGAGTLIVGSGGLSLVNRTGGTANTATGSLVISGGNVIASNSIIKTTSIGTGSITMTGGTLTLAADKTIGTPDIPLDTLTLSSATLNLSVAVSLANINVGELNLVDTANKVNVTALPAIGGFPTVFPLATYLSLPGGGSLDLGTLPNSFLGYLSNDFAGTIWLVVTNGAFVVKSDLWTGAANDNWDTTSLNWSSTAGAVAYGEGDFVTFDDSARTNNVNLTGTRLPTTLTVSNNVLNYTFSGPGSIGGQIALVKDGSAALRLSETGDDSFSAGVTVNNGTLILDNPGSAISGGLTVGSGATVQVGNSNTNGALPSGAVAMDGTLEFRRTDDVTVATAISGAGALTQNGSGKLTLTGASTYTGTTTIANGTLALSGDGSVSSSPLVVVSNATFDVTAAGPQTVLTTLDLTQASLNVVLTNLPAPVSVSSLNVNGVLSAPNTINVLALPPVASYPATLTILKSASPINLVGGSFNFVVGSLPAATPAYVASVSESADQTAVLLTLTDGPIGVRSVVFWTGGDVPNLNTNWSDRLNWQLPGAPGVQDSVIFNNTGAQSASALSVPGGGSGALMPDYFNNIVNADFTIASLSYTNIGGTYHNTAIASGQALNLTNTLTVGTLNTGSPVQQEFVTISGGNAALSIVNTNANLQVWLGSASAVSSQATLDLSALDNFSATISRLTVGASINNAVNRPSGILYLAKTNTLTLEFQTTTSEAGTTTANSGLVVADCNQNNGAPSYIYLGHANTINADSISIGRQKAGGNLLFNPIYANTAPYPSVTFRGFNSSQVSIFDVGDGVGNTGTTTLTADTDLRGGWVTATVGTMNIGRASSGGTAGTVTGSLEFDAGTITVDTLNVGLQPASNTKAGVGTLTVSSNAVMGAGATLAVRGSLNLAAAVGGGGELTTSGTLAINNGTVLANAIVPGVGSISAITLAGGRLMVTNTIGSSTIPLGVLTLASLNTPDNNATLLSLPVRLNGPSLTVTTLYLDGLDTTTNVINIESVGPVDSTPVELPLIQYGSMLFLSGGTFNVGLGALPSGYAGYLTNDTANSAIALVLTSAAHPQPVMTSLSLQSGTNLVISGANGFANAPYYVLGSTDVMLPLAEWTPLSTNVFDGNGNFRSTNAVNASVPTQFFTIQVP